MNFPFDRQRTGDMADVLDMKFRFDARPEFQGQKEESLRELYNWLREQDRKWAEKPKQAESLDEFREVAARLWCDPAMTSKVMEPAVAERIALMLAGKVSLRRPCEGVHDPYSGQCNWCKPPEDPDEDGEEDTTLVIEQPVAPEQPIAAQSLAADRTVADPAAATSPADPSAP